MSDPKFIGKTVQIEGEGIGEELKVCPFCGGTNVKVLRDDVAYCNGEYMVAVCNCGASAVNCADIEKAIAAWNTRTPDPRMVEVLGEAMEYIKGVECEHAGNTRLPEVGCLCLQCELLRKIYAILKGEKPTEPFKEGAD